MAAGILWQKTEGESWIGLQRRISRMELGKIRSWQVRKVEVGLKVSLTPRCISKNVYMTLAISLFIFYLNFWEFHPWALCLQYLFLLTHLSKSSCAPQSCPLKFMTFFSILFILCATVYTHTISMLCVCVHHVNLIYVVIL